LVGRKHTIYDLTINPTDVVGALFDPEFLPLDNGLYPKDAMSSFFIECLAWNVPKNCFQNSTYREDARAVALQIWSDMRDDTKANLYAEISNLKWLFRGQSRTKKQAEDFALKVWRYLEP
jgi:hypothetical protein